MAQSSPQTLVDEGQSYGAAPFLHNLTQRLRKGSSSSHGSDSVPSSPVAVHPLSKTEASRAARRIILSLVRDDWQWPNLPAGSLPNASDRPSIPHRDPCTFRLREEAQSDLEPDEVQPKRRSKSDPYKFESPDAVGDVVVERRRKRRKLVEEEMAWNQGLKTWQERRDAWTGALHQLPSSSRAMESRPSPANKRPSYRSRLSQVFGREKVVDSGSTSHTRIHSHSHSISTDGASSLPASPTSPTQESSADSIEVDSNDSTTRMTTNTTVDPSTPLTPSSTVVPVSSSTSSEQGPWLPIYPPILPRDDIIRDRIKPAAYPTIYSKIVVQGLSPNVPIPLSHMIPALVEGWKSEGQWPPQPSAVLAADKKRGLKSNTLAKWRKEHADKCKDGDVPVVDVGGDGTGRRSSLRRSLGAVRKVLGGAMSSTDGLDELGIQFSEKDSSELNRNVTLNRGLAH